MKMFSNNQIVELGSVSALTLGDKFGCPEGGRSGEDCARPRSL